MTITGQLTLFELAPPQKKEPQLSTFAGTISQNSRRGYYFHFQSKYGNSLNFTWQLTITGQLTFVPKRAPHKVSKSGSNGDAELQTGMRLWVRPRKKVNKKCKQTQ